jgi:hypothetical protein
MNFKWNCCSVKVILNDGGKYCYHCVTMIKVHNYSFSHKSVFSMSYETFDHIPQSTSILPLKCVRGIRGGMLCLFGFPFI